MFKQMVSSDSEERRKIFLRHPSVLLAMLEIAWSHRVHNKNLELGHPFRRSNLSDFPWLPGSLVPANYGHDIINLIDLSEIEADLLRGPWHKWAREAEAGNRTVLWPHLIYAYMIENTRVIEVFRRVVREFMHGEKLGVPSRGAQHWLRATEQLFFGPPIPLAAATIASELRADLGAARRNAYQRMFGMDLNHGTETNQPYAYIRSEAANSQFVTTFEEFLREVWIGIVNRRNQTGANPTDNGKIADLAESLYAMLRQRRESGNLSREEFSFVSTMSWFHLTLDFDSPIVLSLRAEAVTPEQRLFKIAERVGLPAHGLARSYFEIADPLSRVLTLIETGVLNEVDAVPALYTSLPPFLPPLLPFPSLQSDISRIVTHWSIISGRDIKAGKVAPS